MEDTNERLRNSRRTALKTLAVVAPTVLAGCSYTQTNPVDNSPSSTTRDTTTKQRDVLRAVRVEETTLTVSLATETDVSQVTIIDPTGQSFDSSDVSPETQSLSFDLLPTYTPGEYRVVATDGTHVLDERTVMLKPNVEIVEVGVAQNHPEMNWENTDRWHLHAFATVQNTGSGPEKITNLEFEGTPQPTAGAYGSQSIRIEDELVDGVSLAPGAKETVYTVMAPFSPVEQTCRDTTMAAIVRTQVTEPTTARYDVLMSGGSLVDDCTITLERRP